jgi:predicted glycogen debranching enzyme
MSFHFTATELSGFSNNIRREWAMTNGLGGYAGGSIIGACSRTHQGYLIASLHPPVDRYLVFSKTNECLTQGAATYSLETAQHAGEEIAQTVVDTEDVPAEYLRTDTVSVASDFRPRRPIYTQGQKYLTGFTYDGTVSFTYEAGTLTLQKDLALVQGENTVAIAYTITNQGEEASLRITPFMNYREHSSNSTQDSLHFDTSENAQGGFTLIPTQAPEVHIVLSCSEGTLNARSDCYDRDVQYQLEVDNEVPGLDTHFCPYDLTISIPAGSTRQVSLLCRVVPANTILPDERPACDCAHQLVRQRQEELLRLVRHAGFGDDDFANALVIASDQFLAHRDSTGLKTVLAGLPWFTDWGRDTMIAFSGLTLVTGRFEEAREILKTFAKYIHHGMVPNMFPDNGQDPLYNTVDASLWYFYAVDQYLNYTGAPSDYAFIQEEIYPALLEILDAYQKGTDFSIYMDGDYLIHAGSGVDQVTWMDVRVGDWVVTPRHGKPVEINALWYNALQVAAKLARAYGADDTPYLNLANHVADSFCREFWNPDKQCLYDVIDHDQKDDSVRPNQIYAVSLPYTMLSKEQALAVVNTVEKALYAGPGIRSLSTDHKDYHPVYCGCLPKRDAAYHQGTAWGFLMGGFISAYVKVHGRTPEAKKQALAYLEPVRAHLYEGCIGSISEIFDGDAPHTCRGCYAQAWSVGEVLRCYKEDIM